MKVFIGADHRGFKLKEELKEIFNKRGISIIDLGNDILDNEDDHPDFAKRVAEKVVSTPESRGVVICGSGVGVSITANKISGARCAIGLNSEQVEHGVKRDDMNILALASDYLNADDSEKLVDALIQNKFAGEKRDLRRLAKIRAIEKT